MPSSPLVQFSLQTPTFFSMKRQRERVNERGKEKWRDEQKSFRTASRIVTFQQGDNSKCSGSLEHFMPLLFLSTRWFSSSKVYISPPLLPRNDWRHSENSRLLFSRMEREIPFNPFLTWSYDSAYVSAKSTLERRTFALPTCWLRQERSRRHKNETKNVTTFSLPISSTKRIEIKSLTARPVMLI